MAKSSPILALMLGSCLASGAWAQSGIPVEDRTRGPAVPAATVPPAIAPVMVPAAVAQPSAVAGGSVAELLMMVEELQQEVRQLRGMVEEQRYEMRKLSDGQRDRYRDLDRRLTALSERINSGSTVRPAAPTGDSPLPNTSGAVDSAPRVGDREAYGKAFSLVRERAYTRSLAAFEAFVEAYPDSRLIPNAYYWMAEVYRVKPDPDLDKAQQAYNKLVEQYPEHGKVADALYKLALTYDAQGNRPKADALMRRVVAEHPDQSSAALAREYLSRAQ